VTNLKQYPSGEGASRKMDFDRIIRLFAKTKMAANYGRQLENMNVY
jgi:hypothetical protein